MDSFWKEGIEIQLRFGRWALKKEGKKMMRNCWEIEIRKQFPGLVKDLNPGTEKPYKDPISRITK